MYAYGAARLGQMFSCSRRGRERKRGVAAAVAEVGNENVAGVYGVGAARAAMGLAGADEGALPYVARCLAIGYLLLLK